MRALLQVVVFLSPCAVCTGAAPEVKHPNLLLDGDEIKQMRDKIAQYPWAADLLAKTKDLSTRSDAWPASAFGGVQGARPGLVLRDHRRAQLRRSGARLLAGPGAQRSAQVREPQPVGDLRWAMPPARR